ncbi:alpha-E domain-containing protein [Muriicola marianensis]|uniref:DUF403 domain-containing protein n=1 Tax=Muriicola marianensis TaxID=1324801 RepID=A0ABQ1QNB7_9FLAO|nr:alpha-E domain-containing protein [Muriicola marianensis]GGD37933.1 hypothetical protein GCM10011361_01300 [Muriicola marianensis]
MLARVANNLFWMGRYIERSEHIARYMHVNYFSSLDAPHEISRSRQFVLRSMLRMAGEAVPDEGEELNEEEVLHRLALDPSNPFSIISNVRYTRENANSARDLISTELYESINKFYHFVLKYPADHYKKKGLYDFSVNIIEMSSILRGRIRSTLLHDEVYAIILLGVNLERANQLIRMINAKYQDAKEARGSYGDTFSKSFEWTTLLKCLESYDMNRRHYKKTPTSLTTLEFLILNPNCPRSLMNCLNQIYNHIRVLDNSFRYNKDSTAFLVGRVRSEYQYKYIEEIEGNIQQFIDGMLKNLADIGTQMENEFFHY